VALGDGQPDQDSLAPDEGKNNVAPPKQLYWHNFNGCVRREGWRTSLAEDINPFLPKKVCRATC